MKILFVGEIVAAPGRKAVSEVLPEIIKKQKTDLVIANAENLAGGRGVTRETVDEMRKAGVDYFTGGDHVFWQKDADIVVEETPLVRPANYPEGTPGKGYTLIDTGKKGKVLLVNLLGNAFGGPLCYVDNAFSTMDKILAEVQNMKPDYIVLDFHAETSSEKYAMAFYLDGKVTAVVGTHTHVPTCDTRILPLGTMFVTDVGMTGNIDSVLGVSKDIIITMMRTARNQRFEWENSGLISFRSVLLDTDNKTISRIDRVL